MKASSASSFWRQSSWGSPASSVGSYQVRKELEATTSAPLSWASMPAPPKWSGCEWVTITWCTRFMGMPADAMRASSDFQDASPGRPGSTRAKPSPSSMA